MTPETGQKIAYLICFVVISIAVTGYFLGLQAPMNPSAKVGGTSTPPEFGVAGERPPLPQASSAAGIGDAILATRYADMPDATKQTMAKHRTSLSELKQEFDPYAEISITPEHKTLALMSREQNRAFNGAPPTIPHVVERMSAESCMACHGQGFKSESLRITKMSHQFLANCTQCHIESNPSHMTATLFRENTFVGLPAPSGGPRAFQGAPPMIPHSTWMRVDCMSCHGFASKHGIRTTHPARQNCQQCHAPTSELDRVHLKSEPKFLPPHKIINR